MQSEQAGRGRAFVTRPGEAEIRALAVAPGAQRGGVGRALLAELIRRSVAHGARNLLLATLPDMRTAHRLYGRAGFRHRANPRSTGNWSPRSRHPAAGLRSPARRGGRIERRAVGQGAVVTGGSRGIGAAIVRRLAADGAAVVSEATRPEPGSGHASRRRT